MVACDYFTFISKYSAVLPWLTKWKLKTEWEQTSEYWDHERGNIIS